MFTYQSQFELELSNRMIPRITPNILELNDILLNNS